MKQNLDWKHRMWRRGVSVFFLDIDLTIDLNINLMVLNNLGSRIAFLCTFSQQFNNVVWFDQNYTLIWILKDSHSGQSSWISDSTIVINPRRWILESKHAGKPYTLTNPRSWIILNKLGNHEFRPTIRNLWGLTRMIGWILNSTRGFIRTVVRIDQNDCLDPKFNARIYQNKFMRIDQKNCLDPKLNAGINQSSTFRNSWCLTRMIVWILNSTPGINQNSTVRRFA